MTQGAPRTSRTAAKKATESTARDNDVIQTTSDGPELDLDALLGSHGLLGERRLKVAGKSFRLTKAATGEQVAAYHRLVSEGSLGESIATFLVDPTERAEFVEAFQKQRQPLSGQAEQIYFQQILRYVFTGSVDGDAGESSAS